MDARGPLPGAAELLAYLEGHHRPYAIVTNDASRSPATYTARFAGHGITVPPGRFVTSGSLLAGYAPIRGRRTCVLGTADSRAYAEAGGAVVVPLDGELDALAVCDDSGFDFLPGIESALNAVNRAEVFRYLAKPWQQEELVATVQDAFARRDALVRAKQGRPVAAPAGPAAGGHEDVLRQLEQDEPGITRVDWDEHGNIRLF